MKSDNWAASLKASTRWAAALSFIAINTLGIGIVIYIEPDLALWVRLLLTSAYFMPMLAFSVLWAIDPTLRRKGVVKRVVGTVVGVSAAVVLVALVRRG